MFDTFNLDDRLLNAIKDLNYEKPTKVQQQAIPHLLDGKDLAIRSRTGTGKTVSFALPILQHILKKKQIENSKSTKALILAPTKELAEQIYRNFKELCKYSKEVSIVNASSTYPEQVIKPQILKLPDIIIGTPARINSYSYIKWSQMEFLVIDEADLIMSFGYENDVKKVLEKLPQIYQTVLVSATLTHQVDQLKSKVLKNAIEVHVETTAEEHALLTHYSIECQSLTEKFLLLFFLLKFKLVKGKAIIFVNSIDKCFRVKLLLDQFGIASCVLNSELPLNSRIHIVQEFNRGVYDYIIASDESNQEKSQNNAQTRKDKEYGVARGIDFQNAETVINFDFPKDVTCYTHRVGRTARAGNAGLAISFIFNVQGEIREKGVSKEEKQIYTKVCKELQEKSIDVSPFKFDMDAVNVFKYRMDDALRSVTKVAVREARVKEIRKELLHSEKLKAHFEHNPQDLQALRHDNVVHPARIQAHLRHVPDYLIPKKGMGEVDPNERIFLKKRKSKGHKKGTTKRRKMMTDPLLRI